MANQLNDSWAEVAVMILIAIPVWFYVWIYHVVEDGGFFNPLSMLKPGWGWHNKARQLMR